MARQAKAKTTAAKPRAKKTTTAKGAVRAVAAKGPARWTYGFGGGKADGRADMKNLLGGKGANLAEMASLGLPVPPGFTITTEVCTHFYANGRKYPSGLEDSVRKSMAKVEQIVGKRDRKSTRLNSSHSSVSRMPSSA